MSHCSEPVKKYAPMQQISKKERPCFFWIIGQQTGHTAKVFGTLRAAGSLPPFARQGSTRQIAH